LTQFFDCANNAWERLLQDVYQDGEISSPRGMETKEILDYTMRFDMTYPVITHPARNLGYKFMAAEAAWILSGDNRVETILPYAKRIKEFSDDGIRFFGAYGPRIVDQLSYVVDTLVKDPDSRQAVMTIWRPNPRITKDVPCTVSVQWVIREGKLHCLDKMRSSDAWLGWPYDVFNFSMLSAMIAVEYWMRTSEYIEPGTFSLSATSQHIYERNYENVKDVLYRRLSPSDRGPQLVVQRFEHSSDIVSALWEYAVTGDLHKQEMI